MQETVALIPVVCSRVETFSEADICSVLVCGVTEKRALREEDPDSAEEAVSDRGVGDRVRLGLGERMPSTVRPDFIK